MIASAVATTLDGIRPLDPSDPAQVQAVARLHAQLLPTSPLTRLGPPFIQRFYYGKLLGAGLLECNVYYDNGNAVGFLAYTRYSSSFLSRGLRRYWPQFLVAIGLSVLQQPTRLGTMLSMADVVRARHTPTPSIPEGELLSLGVLPEFRRSRYIQQTGRRIALELVQRAMAYFRAHHVGAFHGLVEASNTEALFFYHALGCTFRDVPGVRKKTIRVEYRFANEGVE